jgi:hypothetical protein
MKNLFLSFILLFCNLLHAFSANVSAAHQRRTYFSNDCAQPTKRIDVTANNVRSRLTNDATFLGSGDALVFPSVAGSLPTSTVFAAGMWFGGIDPNGNMKASVGSYDEGEYDFFAGPLDVSGATNNETCSQWDQIFSVKSVSIEAHIKLYKASVATGQPIDCRLIPRDVKLWPGKGNAMFRDTFGWSLPDQDLASFWDMDSDGEYNPCKGDYPYILAKGAWLGYHQGLIIPKQIDFFITNDNGNLQTISGESSMQLELQVHSFAYSTRDELSDMSFYQFNLINKSAGQYHSFYTSLWLDPDIGCYVDDFIGCDPSRNLAYAYNQDAVDGRIGNICPDGIQTYKDSIPALGVGMLEPPLIGKLFKRDLNSNILYDQFGQKILLDLSNKNKDQDTIVQGGLSFFTYAENQGVGTFPPGMAAPQTGNDGGFFNVLRGFWRDSSALVFGGSGYVPQSKDSTRFAFPNDPNDSAGWSMCSANISEGDRRFNMTTGPLVFYPGMQNNFTYYFAPTFDVTNPCPDISKLKFNDDLVKKLFNEGFLKNLSGPDAPDVAAIVGDQKIAFTLSNDAYSNNKNEDFTNSIVGLPPGVESEYVFEGYKVYQLKNKFVRYDQLNDNSLAKLVFQTDVNNDITDISNWRFGRNPDSNSVNALVWRQVKMVSGTNAGISRSFTVSKDFFSSSGQPLENGKLYYYAAVAYAHNNWKSFDLTTGNGQAQSYLEGLRNFKIQAIMPQKSTNVIAADLKKLQIWNNPTANSSSLCLKLAGVEEGDQFDIFNIQGHKLATFDFSQAISAQSSLDNNMIATFDLSSCQLSKGIYLIKLKDKPSTPLRWLVI